VVTAGQRAGAQLDHAGFGGGLVVDHDVEMHLLRPVRVRPLRRLVVARAGTPHPTGQDSR
jgi:hypothetical protein